MELRRVTVFGGSGFIGRYLVKRLAAEGKVLRVAVRDPEGAKFLKTYGAVGQIVPVAASLRNPASIASVVEGADAVVNLVGILYERGAQRFRAVHVDGPRRLAEAARAAGVARLVHVSALGADRNSASNYARSKALGEAAVAEAFPGATIVRPGLVVGPEDAFFNRFAEMARLLPALPLIGGRTRFQPVYVGDVADALTRIVNDPKTAGRTYELGGPKVYTFRELLELMLRVIGRRRLLVPVPFALAAFEAFFLELLPVPPLTRDQVRLLRRDNVLTGTAPGFAELGIEPEAIEAILPAYLDRFAPGGRARLVARP